MSEQPSGLRNPAGAVRGVGAATLVIEALVLLLALIPLARLGDGNAAAIWLCAVLAVVALVLIGLLRFAWAWPGAFVVPVALLAGGALHWSLVALGVLFGLSWAYVLNVRRSVLANRPGTDRPGTGVSGEAPSG